MASGNDSKISSIQLFMLMVGFLYGSTAIMNPAVAAKKDGWIALIFGWTGGVALITLYTTIARKNSDKTLVQILIDHFGKAAGTIIAMLYFWYFLHLASLVLRNFGEFMVTTTFPETPMSVMIALFALAIVYVTRNGLEVVARLAELLVPIIPIPIILVSFSLLTSHDFTAFLPMLEKGIQPVLKAGFSVVTFPYGEAVTFLMVYPHLNKKENTRKVSYLAATVIGIFFLISTYRDLSVLGSDLLVRINYPPNITAKMIPGMNIEPVVVINLLVGGGVKTCICIYAASEVIIQILRIDKERPIITMLTVFCVVLSMWLFTNALDMMRWAGNVWQYYSIPFQIVIPAVLLVISWIKGRKGPAKAKKGQPSNSCDNIKK